MAQINVLFPKPQALGNIYLELFGNFLQQYWAAEIPSEQFFFFPNLLLTIKLIPVAIIGTKDLILPSLPKNIIGNFLNRRSV